MCFERGNSSFHCVDLMGVGGHQFIINGPFILNDPPVLGASSLSSILGPHSDCGCLDVALFYCMLYYGEYPSLS